MEPQSREFKRILLIKPSSLGDIVHALPVLNGLRQRYPDAYIAWLVNQAYAGLLEGHPQLDEVIPFDRQAFGSVWRGVMHAGYLIRFVKKIRRGRFDLVIDLAGLFRSGLMAYASGSPVRLGFSPAREGAGIFYNCAIPTDNRQAHAVDMNYRLSEVLGFTHVPVAFNLPIAQSARESLARKMIQAGLPSDSGYGLILPGTRWETKNWQPACFASLIDAIEQSHKCPVVLGGSGDDIDLCRQVADASRVKPAVIAGLTTLPEMVALVAGASWVVSNDSAPMHLAAALNRPLVAIFGPTDPKRTGPYGHMTSVVQASLPCQPCFLRRLKDCPHDHACMKQLSTEHVLDKWRQVFNGS